MATVTALAAIAVGGVVGPLALLAVAVGLPAAAAGVFRALVRISLVATMPLALSALVINVFFFPAARDIVARIGPLAASGEGIMLAAEVAVRILAISGAITLFYLTTPPAEFVTDLERRGMSSRVAFVANASVQTVPQMLRRAGAIVAAQRARGLDTEGNVIRRVGAIVPVVAPVVLGAINEVEERTLALEARGFTRPGRRTLLWSPPDTRWERFARLGLVLALGAFIAARLSGAAA